jgi:hypothetical protein
VHDLCVCGMRVAACYPTPGSERPPVGTHPSSEATNMKHLRIGLFLATVAVCSCLPTRPDSFAIYFPAGRIPTNDMAQAELAEIELQDEPILSVSDIISYTRATHEIELTASAYHRIQQLDVPVSGLPFVVSIGRKAVYWGAFWTLLSSMPFDGFVILQHPGESEGRVIRIDFGYPSPGLLPDSEDPRANETLMSALERDGKLR